MPGFISFFAITASAVSETFEVHDTGINVGKGSITDQAILEDLSLNSTSADHAKLLQ
jgi:hypothetical protein